MELPQSGLPELRAALEDLGMVPVSTEAEFCFAAYLELLLRWNSRLNLTAIREPTGIIRRHFAESIFAEGQIPAGARTLLDYGSGGGFPGIPISICRPEIEVTLAESQGKKATFLREAVRCLRLNATVWDRRVEEMAADRHFDVVTLRAVDRMGAAIAGGATRVAPGGRMVAFATGLTVDEVRSAASLAWRSVIPIPGSEQGVLLVGDVPRGTA